MIMKKSYLFFSLLFFSASAMGQYITVEELNKAIEKVSSLNPLITIQSLTP